MDFAEKVGYGFRNRMLRNCGLAGVNALRAADAEVHPKFVFACAGFLFV